MMGEMAASSFSGTKSPDKPMFDVECEIMELSEATDGLDKIVSALEDRLHPITASEDKGESAVAPEKNVVQLAAAIRDKRYSVQSSVMRIRSILNRIQL